MRRLLQHAMAAAGISVLTAGVVTGSLVSGSAPTKSVAVAAPVLSSSTAAGLASPVTTDDMDRRLERTNRGQQRVALTQATAASARGKALLAQSQARAQQETALEKKKAEEAKKKAELAKKKAAQEKKRQAEAKKRQAAAKRVVELRKKQAEQKKQQAAARAKSRNSTPSGSPRAIARSLMQSRYGWGASQFSCYNKIIMRESSWKVHADNPSSSAYGIPQALPGSKMASAGPDWRNNAATQIKWGLGYVKSRYGTPCQAWGFKHSHGWY